MTPAVNRLFQELRQGALVITSSRRLARQVEQRYAGWRMSEGAEAWPAPRIRVYDDWLRETWQAAFEHRAGTPGLLSEDQELLLWEQIIRQGTALEDGSYLLQIAGAARTAQQTWGRIHEWCLDRDRLRRYVSADTAAFCGWCSALQDNLGDRHWLTRAQLPGYLMDHGDAWPYPGPQPVWWMGFDTIPPVLDRIMSRLQDQGVRQSRYRSAGIERAEVSTIRCVDVEDQWRRVARWARLELSADPQRMLGVVCPDLRGHRDEIEDILEDVLHPELAWRVDAPRAFHLSLGRPLATYPIVESALDLLRWTARRIPFEIVSRTLRSPHLAGGESELAARIGLELALRQRRQESFPLSHLATLSGGQDGLQRFHALLTSAASIRPPEGTDAGTWAAFVGEWLGAFGWPGDRPLDSREFQILTAWREQLVRFAGLGAVRSRWSLDEVLGKLVSLTAARTLQFHDDQAPLQIMGAQDAVGLWFDTLWLADMSDAVWPPPVRPDPFIPVSLQKASGMPDACAQVVLDRTRARSDDLLASAGHILISFVAQEDGAPTSLSPLFDEYRLEAAQAESSFPGRVQQLVRCHAPVELIDDRQAPELRGNHLHGGVGLVADQARCPFRALAHYRLNVRALRDIVPGFDAAERGRLVHDAARRLWERLREQQTLNTMVEDELRSLVGECVAGALESQLADTEFRRRLLDIERERLVGLLLEWLALEKQRSSFRVVGTELETRVSLGGVEFHLRVDRIDALDRGRLIIDYKSGRLAGVRDWLNPRMEEPQLPMYALALGGDVAGLVFAALKPGKCELSGIADDPGGLPSVQPVANLGVNDMAELETWWASALGALVVEHRRGVAGADPRTPRTCRSCDAASLCRIFERTQLVDD